MPLRLIEAPTLKPVSAADVRAALRLDETLEDWHIEGMIDRAVSEIDGPTGWLGRALMTQTLQLTLPCFPTLLRVPYPPLQSMESLTYWGALNLEEVMDPGAYRVVDCGIMPALIQAEPYDSGWPQLGTSLGAAPAVTLRFVAGWPDPAAVPGAIKNWVIGRVGSFYQQPESTMIGLSISSTPHFNGLIEGLRIWTV